MKYYQLLKCLLILILLTSGCKETQDQNTKADVPEIRNVLMAQEKAWNKGDLEGYMEGYWKDNSLTFVGKSGINYGWTTTLNNYRRGYPDKDAMGKLHFEVVELTPLSPGLYYMLGQYTLTRKDDKPTGYFSLIWKMIDGKWKIISDHTSG